MSTLNSKPSREPWVLFEAEATGLVYGICQSLLGRGFFDDNSLLSERQTFCPFYVPEVSSAIKPKTLNPKPKPKDSTRSTSSQAQQT